MHFLLSLVIIYYFTINNIEYYNGSSVVKY